MSINKDFTFTTEISKNANFDFFNFEITDLDYDMFEDITIKINWTATLDIRHNGIRDIIPSINSIDIDGMYVTTDDIDKYFTLNLKEDIDFTYVEPYDKEWKIKKIYINSSDDSSFTIDNISLDFKDKTIDIEINPYIYD